MSVIYATPVPVLQKVITPQHFAELLAYDQLCGLDRHDEPADPTAGTDVETMAKARWDTNKQPKYTGLNRRPIEVGHGTPTG